MTQIDAFILIGGQSSRLGSDKAFVELGGKTLSERAMDTTQAALSPNRVTLVAGNSLQLATHAIASGVEFIFDLYEGRGPIAGLHAALANARTPWIFLLACDYPFVSADLIQLLAGKISDEFGVVVPEQSDGRLQPLCAFYNVGKALPLVELILERPRVSPPMHEVVSDLNPLIVTFEEYAQLRDADELFLNVNTHDDLDIAREIKRKLSPAD